MEPQASQRDLRRRIQKLTRDARKSMQTAESTEERIARFNHFFFEQAGFRPLTGEESQSSLLLNHVLQDRRGNCVGLTQAYLAIAERLKLPVVAAATPTHLFIRWRANGERVNVELLETGTQRSDSEYRERYRIREANPDDPLFLRDLGSREVAARVHNNLGVVQSRAGRLDQAGVEYARALELDPRFPAPLYNRGLDHLTSGRAREALEDLEAALALYPSDAWALNNHGLARLRLGERERALESFRKALAIDPDFETAKANLRLVEPGNPPGEDASSFGTTTGPRP